MVITYGSDIETIKSAVSYDFCAAVVIATPFILIFVNFIHQCIEDAYFINSYFEGDLNGLISYSDLSDITGDPENIIKRKINFYSKFFMKNFVIKDDENKQIILNSKKVDCICNNCGGAITDPVYENYECRYCQSKIMGVVKVK